MCTMGFEKESIAEAACGHEGVGGGPLFVQEWQLPLLDAVAVEIPPHMALGGASGGSRDPEPRPRRTGRHQRR
ncbi:hypothetical protein BDA96_02G087100 [Sorghum bicolor]|uniref:Uncharacterized protein n=2 Tax=Sorghum bicolor TaxID=4558 RepID=A0A921RM23_SORBI|nr:hypothetical protein BDA96_02G087100 [Sorghum bicolor]KXG34736.1 hypothetical protein SORBI_3002G083700 [Sorghum bicolor]